jgi:hypothetical protein
MAMARSNPLLAVLVVVALVFPAFAVDGDWLAAAQGVDGLGEAVTVTDEEDDPVGTVTVIDVIDPFMAFDPAFPPEEGSRYVVANVAFESDAGERFDIAPWAIVLQDAEGFLWNPASLILPDDALVPVLSSETLAPGSRVTGAVGFVLPEGTVPARVLYQPESSRFVQLADLLDADVPAVGEAVEIVDSEGGVGTVTLAAVTDPFEDVAPGVTPPQDTRFVMLTLVYENTGTGRFFIEPFGLVLQDESGRLWSTTFVDRPDETAIVPDLTSAQLAPGDRLTGAAVFAVPEGTEPAAVYLGPTSNQLLLLADLRAEPSIAPSTPIATPVSAVSEVSDKGLEDEIVEACVDFEQWLAATRARIELVAGMTLDDATLEDLEQLAAQAGAYAEMAEAQLAEAAPPEADAVNQALVETLRSHGAAIERILGATEPGKDTLLELTEGVNAFTEAGQRLHEIEDELAEIAAACGLS